MGIINRTKDDSSKRLAIDIASNGSQTSGETGILCYIPTASVFEAANLACFNSTSQVYMLLKVNRFIPGSGFTSWNLGTTFSIPSFGTSGVFPNGLSLPASGSTLNILMHNDVISYELGGGSTAAIYGIAGSVIIKPLQDISVYLGLV